jgi:limonene-1,2-epoxide hydrolase
MTPAPPPDAQSTVVAFLTALAASDVDGAGALLAEDVVYSNVGLPTIRGRGGVLRVLGPLAGPRARFEVYLHAIAADGAQVLTERTDVIEFGRLRFQFWVAGRFDVHDGRITLWRDSFDFLDCARAAVRGLLGALVPALRPRPPATSGPPGRR